MIFSQYYFESNRYVPDRLLRKVDNVASALTESGLNRFYQEIVQFNQHLMTAKRLNQNENDNSALNSQQFQRLFMLFLYNLGIALLLFFVEVIIFKFNWWCCRQYSKRRVHQSHSLRPRRPRRRAYTI